MRVLFAEGVDRGSIDALARALGWQLVMIRAARPERPGAAVFATAAGELLTFVDDPTLDARHLQVDGHDPAALVEIVRAALPCRDVDAVLAIHAREPARGLALLGLVAPETACEPILGVVRAGLESADPALRAAAAIAAEASGWPELRVQPNALAPPPPERPRLSEAVLARRHVVDGEAKIILQEPRTGAVLEIDPDSYRVLELADGTRDLDALALALAREGRYRGAADLRQLIGELDDAGVLEDGLPAPSPAPPVSAPTTPLERPLDVLAGYTLVCDGSGSCCRFYGSVAFSPREALQARLCAEAMDLPIPPEALFTPMRGAAPGHAHIVAQIDGCCAFLEADGRCGIHRRAGAATKPFPCGFYPATLVDDGTAVRVSLGPECACIFASVGRSDGEPLVPLAARTLADLPPGVPVMHVPDPVPLSPRRTAPRAALARWSAHLAQALDTRPLDAAALAWQLADTVAEAGLDLDALERALGAPPSLGDAGPWLSALGEHAERLAQIQERWRSATDLSRAVARWIARALPGAERSPPLDPASERFYLRALAHGHRLAVEGRPLAHGLRDRAVRILAARAMSEVEPPPHASARYPLALLEAAMRNLALSGYADAL